MAQSPGRLDPDGGARIVRECLESPEDFRRRQNRFAAAIALPGAAAALAGGLTFGLARDWDRTPPPPMGGDICIVGKPCGDACIAMEDTCHIEDAERGAPLTRGGLIAGIVLVTIGIGLMLGGSFGSMRLQRRTVSCSTAGCSLGFRF